MKVIEIERGSLKLTEIASPAVPGPTEIKIKVKAAGVNRADLLQRKGLYPPPAGVTEVPGLEVAGEVVGSGSSVSKFKGGDRVMALLAGGGYAEYVLVEADHAMHVPTNRSFEEAAGICEVFLTAYQSLVELANVNHGEVVLVHAGGSGVGTAAIQLATLLGAKVAATAGSEEKLARCKALGAGLTINYKTDPDFHATIKSALGGVDVILDFIGSSYFDRNLACLKPDGRWILLAFLGGARVGEVNLATLLTKRIRLIGSTLRGRDSDYKAGLIGGFERKALPAFEKGQLKPVIDKVFPWEEAEKAHNYIEENRNTGKVILRVSS